MARIVRTSRARDQLHDIARHIAQESQSIRSSLEFLDLVDERCRLYARHPEIGTARPDLAPGVRCFSVKNYVVFYEPLADGVKLLRVYHGSRDIPILFREE